MDFMSFGDYFVLFWGVLIAPVLVLIWAVSEHTHRKISK